MKVLGIIAEYNPFHNGHAYHLAHSKKYTGADVTVAVMSGNFVQRGEPAVLNKWIRSKTAVQNGIDLVLELPFVYACNDAGIFARGAVGILEGLGCVDYISFGSETGDIKILNEIVDVIEPETEEFSLKFRENLSKGLSYAAAREETIAFYLGEEKAEHVGKPNNILGIEYLKQLKLLKSKITPITVKRHGASLNEINDEISIAGATALRNMINMGDLDGVCRYMPDSAYDYLLENRNVITDMEKFREIIQYSVISKNPEELAKVYSVKEGLENRIKDAVRTSKTVRDIIDKTKTKRYAETRVRRILMHILNNLKRKTMTKILEEGQIYGRVLAFNETGASFLKVVKKSKSSVVPVITNIVKEGELLRGAEDAFAKDIMASDIYNLIMIGDLNTLSEYKRVPAFVK